MAAITPPQTRAARRGLVTARPRKPGERRTVTGIWNLVAVAAAIVLGFPIYYMLLTTLESNKDLISQNPRLFPSGVTGANYSTVFNDSDFFNSLKNTALITLGAVVFSLLIGLLAALAVARFRFPGRRVFIVSILITQMIPLLALIIPLFLVLRNYNLTDTLLGVILSYLVFTIPYVVWTLRTFIVNIPRELEEAAMVDGCTRWQAFYKIVLPLVMPGFVATGIYAWITAWNEFIIANVMLTGSQHTSMIWLTYFSTTPTHGADFGGQIGPGVGQEAELVTLPAEAVGEGAAEVATVKGRKLVLHETHAGFGVEREGHSERRAGDGVFPGRGFDAELVQEICECIEGVDARERSGRGANNLQIGEAA